MVMSLDELSDLLRQEWKRVLDAPAIQPDPQADALLDGSKTLRYVAFTQILGKIADPTRDIFTIQAQDPESVGPWDARTVAHNVVVKWEQSEHVAFLGGSPEPYVNNPVRIPRLIRTRTDVKNRLEWQDLYDYLEPLQTCDRVVRHRALVRLLGSARRRLERQQIQYAVPYRLSIAKLLEVIETYLAEPSGGERPLAIAAALFDTLGKSYQLFASIEVQRITESDSATGTAGDITCMNKEGVLVVVVEVKDRALTDQALHTSVQKLRQDRSAVSPSLVFAVPDIDENDRDDVVSRIEKEYSAGMNIHWLTLSDLARVAFSLLAEEPRIDFLINVGSRLDELASYKHREAWQGLMSSL